MKKWYLKVKFREKFDGRKIWYQCSDSLCDCINKPFENKERCEKLIPRLRKEYGDRIESITIHWIKRG